MQKIKFTCQTCGKIIMVQENIYNTIYKGKKDCLDCRKGAKGEWCNAKD
jgi:DNA replicative helicase MCM subunit Mcm2 (Cdc46/Mcm family)